MEMTAVLFVLQTIFFTFVAGRAQDNGCDGPTTLALSVRYFQLFDGPPTPSPASRQVDNGTDGATAHSRYDTSPSTAPYAQPTGGKACVAVLVDDQVAWECYGASNQTVHSSTVTSSPWGSSAHPKNTTAGMASKKNDAASAAWHHRPALIAALASLAGAAVVAATFTL
ncbi:hypothetical protein B0H63DRAFT_515981 [Podospora didyma]|uniref:Uncharacterized protein n=1 Tax=Podospora didyma TaxID=330526 RepID=A0AAE0P3S3_9PEZI|nr:hypothetical protein B0H63DRAFT_530031 [Podospora didyma]KAK3392764.1 hypothetical protein B0H63DRAFT_515981 [Podospora didyma]